MPSCERCCYFEFCTREGRTEEKDCVNRHKDKGESDERKKM